MIGCIAEANLPKYVAWKWGAAAADRLLQVEKNNGGGDVVDRLMTAMPEVGTQGKASLWASLWEFCAEMDPFLDELLRNSARTFGGFLRCLSDLLPLMSTTLDFERTPSFAAVHLALESTEMAVLNFSNLPKMLGASGMIGFLCMVANCYFGVQSLRHNQQMNSSGEMVLTLTLPKGQRFDQKVPMEGHGEGTSLDATYCMDAATFSDANPYHFLVSLDGRLLQAGEKIQWLLPEVSAPGALFQANFQVLYPPTNAPCNIASMMTGEGGRKSGMVILKCNQGLEMRGMFRRTCMPSKTAAGGGARPCMQPRSATGDGNEVQEAFLFLGSPRIDNLEDMKQHGLCLTDLGPLSADYAVTVHGLHLAGEMLKQNVLQLEDVLSKHMDAQRGPSVDSPVALALIEKLIQGDMQITALELATARQELLSAAHGEGGTALLRSFEGDAEVAKSLQQLLEPYKPSVQNGKLTKYPGLQTLREEARAPADGGQPAGDFLWNLGRTVAASFTTQHSICPTTLSKTVMDVASSVPVSLHVKPVPSWTSSFSFRHASALPQDLAGETTPQTQPQLAAPVKRDSVPFLKRAKASLKALLRFKSTELCKLRVASASAPGPSRPTLPTLLPAGNSECGQDRSTPPSSEKKPIPQSVILANVLHSTPHLGKLNGADMMMQLVREPTDQLHAILDQVDSWSFDSFALEQASEGRPLSTLAFFLFVRLDFISRFSINAGKLARFLTSIEAGYQPNPYHSRTHAADVLRTLHAIMTRGDLLHHSNNPEHLKLGVLQKELTRSAQAIHLTDGHSQGPPTALASSLQLHEAFMVLTMYLAAIVHDFDHRGVNNQYLVTMGDELAMQYNDISPMENHHLAAAFKVLKNEKCNFLDILTTEAFNMLRSNVIELVLVTDMKVHFGTLDQFDAKVTKALQLETMTIMDSLEGNAGMALFDAMASTPGNFPIGMMTGTNLQGSGNMDRSNRFCSFGSPRPVVTAKQLLLSRQSFKLITSGKQAPSGSFNSTSIKLLELLELPEDKVVVLDGPSMMLVWKVALKCADLGHLANELSIHKKWVLRLEEEMFRQGDQEHAAGIPISPLMDRSKTGITKSQVGFFNVVALPMYKSFATAFPDVQPLLDGCRRNFDAWSQLG